MQDFGLLGIAGRNEVCISRCVAENLYSIRQYNFCCCTVCGVFGLYQQRNYCIICIGISADNDGIFILVQCIGINVGIGTIIQVRYPCRDADFRLTGCHRQPHAAEVTAGRRIRQIVVQIFGDLRNIRCRVVSNFGNSRICCLRRCNLIGRGSGNHRAAHGSCHKRRR